MADGRTGELTELRFARAAQARLPAMVGGLLAAAAVVLLTNLALRTGGRFWQTPWLGALALFLLLGGVLLLRHAWRCLRHPLLIVSPVGVEIFPLWRPGRNFRLVAWQEIAGLGWSGRALRIDRHGGGGVVLALAPLSEAGRENLRLTLLGRAQQLELNWEELGGAVEARSSSESA